MLAYAYNFLERQDLGPTPFERLLRRDRAIVGIALLILILLAWLLCWAARHQHGNGGHRHDRNPNSLYGDQDGVDMESSALEWCKQGIS
jgi:predicted metal-binding membrane protein